MLSVRSRTAIFLCLFLLGFSVNAIAQATGTVSGRVLDQSGGVLPGVAIDLVVNSRELTTSTDGFGWAAVTAPWLAADAIPNIRHVSERAPAHEIGRGVRKRPVMRAGEVLETVPGMVVSQHSGEGQ